jgi:hypothetical protein
VHVFSHLMETETETRSVRSVRLNVRHHPSGYSHEVEDLCEAALNKLILP